MITNLRLFIFYAGDKLETAFEIAYSCHLFSSDSNSFTSHKLEAKPGDKKDDILHEMSRISSEIHSKHTSAQQEHGLIFEGQSRSNSSVVFSHLMMCGYYMR